MGASQLLEDDLVDLLFTNKVPEFSMGTLHLSLHSGKSPHVYTQPIENLQALGEVKLTIEASKAANIKPGDIITLNDGSKALPWRNFTVREITSSVISAELTLVPVETPQPIIEDPVADDLVDEPESEEVALDIDVELGISQSEM